MGKGFLRTVYSAKTLFQGRSRFSNGLLSEGKFEVIHNKNRIPDVEISDLLQATKHTLCMSSPFSYSFYKKPEVYKQFKRVLEDKNITKHLIFDASSEQINWDDVKSKLQTEADPWIDRLWSVKGQTHLYIKESKEPITHWLFSDGEHIRVEQAHDFNLNESVPTNNVILHNVSKSIDKTIMTIFDLEKEKFESRWRQLNSV